jgi:hypothetical protein
LGLGFRPCRSYMTGMLQTKPKPHFHIGQFAHDRALHFLARPKQYGLTSEAVHQLTQVAEGFTGSCDEPAARAGIDWMRQHYRLLRQTPTF